MKNIPLKYLVPTLILTLLPCLHAEDWKQTLRRELPLLGHRNWIVVTDSAYPWQVSPGVQTIATGTTQQAVVKEVLSALRRAGHVKPSVLLDRELGFVPENLAPGITAYRRDLDSLLSTREVERLPHEQIISKLDEAGKTFHVLLLKTNLQLPYTSVFFRLDCGYWNAPSEKRLRALIPAK